MHDIGRRVVRFSSLSSPVQVGNTNAAFDRFKEMALRGLSPDSSTFGALLHACAQVQLPLIDKLCILIMVPLIYLWPARLFAINGTDMSTLQTKTFRNL